MDTEGAQTQTKKHATAQSQFDGDDGPGNARQPAQTQLASPMVPLRPDNLFAVKPSAEATEVRNWLIDAEATEVKNWLIDASAQFPKTSADAPFACNSNTSVLASPVESFQETTCTMVGKPLDVLPLLHVQTRESDTPSGYCSNPHVPTVMTIPNKTTPATCEPVLNSVMTNFHPNQPNCLPQIPSGAFSNIDKPTSTCDNLGPLSSSHQVCANSQRGAMLEGLCALPGSPTSPLTRFVEERLHLDDDVLLDWAEDTGDFDQDSPDLAEDTADFDRDSPNADHQD